ncbi:hypothetical protein AB5J62_19340 [Amycolatopsis sp. cg5]|uniref:hypothetical protein n=1 Tax=Amycolatopsis sp. cg5 TaxID=3238802 RepID=UPI003523B21A
MAQPELPGTDSNSTAESELKLVLIEYDQVKSEQRNRIQHRDGLVYTTIAAMGAILAATISQRTTAVLLLLPPVGIVLGWKYLANDAKIGSANSYVRERLSPRATEITGSTGPVFGWETYHRVGVFHRARRFVQVVVDLLTFCVLPCAALIGFWVVGPCPAGLLVVSIVEVVLLVGLGWLVGLAFLSRDELRGVPAGVSGEVAG